MAKATARPSVRRAKRCSPGGMASSRPEGKRTKTSSSSATVTTPAGAPFSTEELDRTITSFRNLVAMEADESKSSAASSLDFDALRALIAEYGHLSHKDWARTSSAASELEKILSGPDDERFRRMFARVLEGGKWPAAAEHAASVSSSSSLSSGDSGDSGDARPWVVLVCGVNAIRKTTSVHMPWFKQALKQALGEAFDGSEASLPDGSNSFFRQLDFVMASVANEEFRNLYAVEDRQGYTTAKAAIFSRFRMLSEMLGVVLVRHAAAGGLNVMVETSGRDIAMFNYIDRFFDDAQYVCLPPYIHARGCVLGLLLGE